MKVKHIVGIMTALVLTVVLAGESQALFGFGKYESVEPVDGIVTIPVSEVNDGEAHYYVYEYKGAEVKFFVLMSKDGVIRAAFDACDVCFLEKKGYSQDGDFMVCNNCGMRFHSSRINEVKGGCNPSPLERSFDDRNITIKVTDIMTGYRYFK